MLLKTLLATTAVVIAAPALAADLSESTNILPSPVSGYLEAYFGIGTGQSQSQNDGPVALDVIGDDSDHFTSTMFGGSGRVAFAINPGFSMQADGWYDDTLTTDNYNGGTSTYSRTSSGLGVHATWRAMNAAFGGLVSVGQNSAPARYANLAAEGAWYGAMSSFMVQAGYTAKFSGAPFHESGVYGHAMATFFHNPNLAFSGDVGLTSQSAGDDDGYAASNATAVQWGARVDFKPEQVPFSFFVAYQGVSTNSNFSFDYGSTNGTSSGTSHAVFAGARYVFGADSLQSLDRTAGFKDYNVIFGTRALGSIAAYD